MREKIIVNSNDNSEITDETVKQIIKLIKEDYYKPDIKMLASRYSGNSGREIAKKIYDDFKKRFVFVADPPGLEILKNPSHHARRIYQDGFTTGDCDENSALVASMLLHNGLPARLIVMSNKPHKKFHHIFSGFKCLSSEREIFVVDPQEKYFERWPKITKARIYPIF